MRTRDSADGFGLVSIVSHWVLASIVFALLISGLVAAEWVEDSARDMLLGPHRAIGAIAPLLVLAMFGWWALQRARPGPVPGTSAAEAWARKAMHVLLLIGTVVLSLAGVTMAVFNGKDVDILGVLTIPAQTEIPWLAELAHEVHEIGGWVLLIAVLGHAAVALKHHFLDHDRTFTRMFGCGA